MTNVASRTIAVAEDATVTLNKDPDEELDYTLNWAGRLNATEHISTSSFVRVDGIPFTIDLVKGTTSLDNTTTTLWLSGGEAGRVYHITNHVMTTENRKLDYTFSIQCVSR